MSALPPVPSESDAAPPSPSADASAPPEVYLDHNASAPLLAVAREAMEAVWALGPGNASSAHAAGRRLRRVLEDAREQVAALVEVTPSEVIFTSGATESNALALHGALAWHRRRVAPVHVVGTRADHESTARTLDALAADGTPVDRIGVDREGRIDVDEAVATTCPSTVILTLPHAESVTGTLQPVAAVAAALGDRSIVVHADAAQSVGRMEVTAPQLGAGLLTLSGHKIGAPTGVGALIVRKGVSFEPPWGSGSQERGRRSGSAAVALAAAFGAAAAWAQSHRAATERTTRAWVDALRGALNELGGCRIVTPTEQALPNTCLVLFDGCPGDAVAAALDARGLRVSTGSACTSGARVPPGVLLAGGWARADAASAVRISVGPDTSDGSRDALLRAIRIVVPRVRAALSTG